VNKLFCRQDWKAAAPPFVYLEIARDVMSNDRGIKQSQLNDERRVKSESAIVFFFHCVLRSCFLHISTSEGAVPVFKSKISELFQPGARRS
jgi:hypothetical protein